MLGVPDIDKHIDKATKPILAELSSVRTELTGVKEELAAMRADMAALLVIVRARAKADGLKLVS